jgi:hypothetical protein
LEISGSGRYIEQSGKRADARYRWSAYWQGGGLRQDGIPFHVEKPENHSFVF